MDEPIGFEILWFMGEIKVLSLSHIASEKNDTNLSEAIKHKMLGEEESDPILEEVVLLKIYRKLGSFGT